MKLSNILTFLAVLLLSGESFAAEPRGQYFSIGDDRIYYEDLGDGFPLVLVSGGSGMDLRQWSDAAEALSKHYRVISVDPRGVGQSDVPSVSFSGVDDLEQLLIHLQLDAVGLIGLSSAGGFVLEYALQKPERVAGVVAAAPFVPGFQFSESMLARLQVFTEASQKGNKAFVDSMLADQYFMPAPLNPSVRDFARKVMAYNYDKRATIDYSLFVEIDPPLIEQLDGITPPVLLLVGELDHPDVGLRNKLLLDKVPNATESIVADSGHNVPLENLNGFLDAITPFLKGLQD